MKTAKNIAALGVMAALLIAGKWSLNAMPNVEVVSLFTALFGYVFGYIAIIPVLIFCTEELFSWGFGGWIAAYYIYFCALSAIFSALGKKKVENIPFILCIIAILTVLFGVISAVTESLITGTDGFFYKFSAIYAKGVTFYIIHVISNVALFGLLFNPLKKILCNIKAGFLD